MSGLPACESCFGREQWRIARMLEHSSDGWQALGAPDGLAPMSTAICRSCGHVAWHATPAQGRDERLTLSRRIVDERLECRDCLGRPHLLVAVLFEAADGYSVAPLAVVRRKVSDAGGRFAVLVCEGCGRAEWFACDVSRFDGESCDGSCRRCERPALRRVRPLREENGRLLPVAVVDGKPYGELEVRWCDECGACDWRAHRIDELVPDGENIVRDSADERVPVAGGPYR